MSHAARELPTKTRLGLVLGLILIASITAVSVINYNVTKESVRHEILDSGLPLTRDNIYSEIHSKLMEPIFVSSLMANDTFVQDWVQNGETDIVPITRYLKTIKAKYNYFSTFFVSAKTMNYYHYSGVLKSISPDDSHDVWYYNFLKSGKEYILDVDTDEASGGMLTIFINFRVTDKRGKLLGVTGVGIRMAEVSLLLEETQRKYDRTIFLTDRRGLIQVHSDPQYIEKTNIGDMPGIRSVASTLLATTTGPANYEYDLAHNHFLLTSRFIPELSWFLVVEQNETSSLNSARNNLYRTIAFGLISALIVIAMCLATVDKFQKSLVRQACTDELTGIANRREFEQQFDLATYSYSRTGSPFSIILIDMDGLKAINDTYGHSVGDQAIRFVASKAKSIMRPSDLLARWGGDEFIILSHCDAEGAHRIIERIRAALAGDDPLHPMDREIDITVSCGVAQFENTDSLESMIKRADIALYQEKQSKQK